MRFEKRRGPVTAGGPLDRGLWLIESLAGIAIHLRRPSCGWLQGTRTGSHRIVRLAAFLLSLGSPGQTQAIVLTFPDFRIVFDEVLYVPENETGVVTVSREGNLDQPLDLSFVQSGGTARPNIDYLPFDPLSFHFAPGERTKRASIALIDNSKVDDPQIDRTIELQYQGPNPPNGNGGAITSTIVITDNEMAPSIDVNYRPENALGSSPLAVQSDGRIVLVGYEDLAFRSHEDLRLIRLNQDGSRDASFHGGLALASDEEITAIYCQPDDRILVLRREIDNYRGSIADLLRFETNGFWLSGFSLPPKFSGLASAFPLNDGRTLIQGSFGIARLLQNGAEDFSFQPGAGLNQLASYGVIETFVELPSPNDGRVVLGLSSIEDDPALAPAKLVRLNRDGSLDSTFKPSIVYAGGSIRSQSNGKFVLYGTGVDAKARLFRLELDGSLDHTFNSPAPEGDCLMRPLFDFRPGGGVVVAGYGCSRLPSRSVAKFKDDGSSDGHYTADYIAILSAMRVEPNNDLLLSVPSGILYNPASVGGSFVRGSARILANPPRTQLLVAAANPDFDSICHFQIELYAPAEEVGGVARLNLLRQGDSGAAARVRFSTVDGTAKAGQDYSFVSGLAEFLPLETKKTITIPIFDRHDSGNVSEDQTFAVHFSDAQGFESFQKSITVKIPKHFARRAAATLKLLNGAKLQLSNTYPDFSYQLQSSTDLKSWQTEISIDQGNTELLLSELQFASESRQFFRVVGSLIRPGCN